MSHRDQTNVLRNLALVWAVLVLVALVGPYLVLGWPIVVGLCWLTRALQSRPSHRIWGSMDMADKPKELLIIPGVLALGALVLAIVVQVMNYGQALRFATWTWLGAMIVALLFSALWGAINEKVEPDLSNRLRVGSQALITINGVVLALVYKNNGQPIPEALKWGGIALLASLMLALLVYTVISGEISPGGPAVMATGTFVASVFAFVYGLTCIVFAVVWP